MVLYVRKGLNILCGVEKRKEYTAMAKKTKNSCQKSLVREKYLPVSGCLSVFTVVYSPLVDYLH